MKAAVESDGEMAAGKPSGEPDATRPWYPPLPLWKLFLLLVLTLSLYSVFYLYRTARELRDHGHPQLKPWLYPFAYLIPITAGIAAGRLASKTEDTAAPEERFAGARPVFVGLGVFAGHMLLSAAGLSSLTSAYIGALVLYALPWLLLQHQLNRIKRERLASAAPIEFRSRPERYTRLQWAGLAVGGVALSFVGFALWDDYQRLSGDKLSVDEPYVDPGGRFVLQAPAGSWTIVGPGYLADDAELELLGPGPSDWAVLYVHEQAGWSIDDLVEFRFQQLADFTRDYHEKRRFVAGTEIAVSHAAYSGMLAMEGRSDYAVTSFVTPERAVEFIVFTAGTDRALAGGTELAESLRPPSGDGAL